MAPAPILRLRGGSADARTASTAAYCGVPISARSIGWWQVARRDACAFICSGRCNRSAWSVVIAPSSIGAGTGRPSQDRPSRRGGRCGRPRAVRELLRDPGVRTAGAAQLSQPRRGAHGDLRFRRSRSRTTRGRRLHEHTGSGDSRGPTPSFSAAPRSAGWSPCQRAS